MQAVIICNSNTPALSSLFEGRNTAGCFVLGKTILEHTIKQLLKEKITSITVAIKKNAGELLTLCEKLSAVYPIKIFTSDDNPVKIIRRAWQGEEMLVTECKGNALHNLDNLCKIHKKTNSPLTATVKTHHNTPFELSAVPSTEFSYTGVYILSQEVVASIPMETKITTIKELAEFNDRSLAVNDSCEFIPINTPADLLLANHKALCNVDLYTDNPVMISQGFYNMSGEFLRGVTIIPPVFVGKNTTVGKGTVLEGNTVIGDNVTIGEGCYIKGSVVGDGSVIGDKATLDNALLDRGVNVMKGANLKKMTVIGAKTTIGNDAVIMEGVKVHSGKTISPQLTVCKDVSLYTDGVVFFDDEGAITDLHGFITPSFCADFGCAVASALNSGDSVMLCSNGKKSALLLGDAVASGLCSAGVNVWRLDNATKGEICYAMDKTNTHIAIELTVDFKTSIKIFSKGGLKIPYNTEKEIEDNLNFSLFRLKNSDGFGDIKNADAFSQLYVSQLSKELPPRFKGLNVTVKTCDKKTAQLCDMLFCNKNDINGEAVTFHINNTNEGLSAYSERTGYIFNEKLTLIAVKFHLSQGNNIALPETFPDVCESLSEDYPGEVFRYKLDSDGITDKASRKIAGDEENLFVNDSLALAVKIISIMQNNNLSLKKLSADLPSFYTTKRFVTSGDLQNTISLTSFVSVDNSSKAIIKPVKNKKGYVIYAQSVNAETATAFCDEIEQSLKQLTVDN